MKVFIKVLLAFVLLFSAQTFSNANCQVGGEGATSCSITHSQFFGLITTEYSVSCGDGYYACCNEGVNGHPTANCHESHHNNEGLHPALHP